MPRLVKRTLLDTHCPHSALKRLKQHCESTQSSCIATQTQGKHAESRRAEKAAPLPSCQVPKRQLS